MVTNGRCACEHSIMYRLVESLCCVPETIVTLCVNDTTIKQNKNKNKKRVYPFTSWQGTPCPANSQFVYASRKISCSASAGKHWPMLDCLKTAVRLASSALFKPEQQVPRFSSSFLHKLYPFTYLFFKNHSIIGDLGL